MKKAISILLVCMLVFSITACQTTQTRPIVIRKDAERMVEKAAATEEVAVAAMLREQVKAPAQFAYAVEEYDGRFKLNISAEVSVPEVTAIPIVAVQATDFSEEISIHFFNLFCAGEDMFDDSQRMTKAEIERAILANEKLKQSDDYVDDPVGQEQIDFETEALKKEYLTAPEKNEPVKVDGSFYKIPVKDPHSNVVASYQGVDARGESMAFKVENSNGLEKPIIYEYEGGWSGLEAGSNARLSYYTFEMWSQGRWGAMPLIDVTDRSGVPTEAHGRLHLTVEEARAMAATVLEGTGLEVCGVYLTCDLDIYNPDMETRTVETANYGYEIRCTRAVSGVRCITGAVEALGAEYDPYALSWPHENARLFITDDGVMNFWWNSPLKIAETRVENTTLLPFADIIAIFTKMAAVPYAPNAARNEVLTFLDNRTSQYRMTIDEIRLELQRIREPNNVNDGLLVPAWGFYGQAFRSLQDGTEGVLFSDDPAQCLMIVNAIDGTVIDATRGY